MSVKVFGNLVPRTFRNERKFQIFVQESCFDFIPRGMKKPVYKQYLKEILMDKYGPSAFLFPDEMMFPVKNIHTGLYDCRLIQYAVVRALTLRRISHDFDYILEAAMKCFLEHGCKESVKITLTDTGEEISLISFLKMLSYRISLCFSNVFSAPFGSIFPKVKLCPRTGIDNMDLSGRSD